MLPKIESPSAWDALSLLNPDYDAKTFSHDGDLMPKDRLKLIHGYGSTALIAFIPTRDHPYTGLFGSGAPYGLVRISLAKAPSVSGTPKLLPGLGLKFFIDGKPSVNVLAMPSLDPQSEFNIFAHSYTTDIAMPSWSILNWLLETQFTRALTHVGQSGGNPRSLSLTQLASQTSLGEVVSSPVEPYALALVPQKDLQNFCETKRYEDFRVQIEGQGVGMTLFEVKAQGAPGGEFITIGTIVARSGFIASSFGDEKLFFKHPPVHMPESLDEL